MKFDFYRKAYRPSVKVKKQIRLRFYSEEKNLTGS